MPTERILITPDEFRATSATNDITFSSKNRYLKTSSGGTFRIGGYSRAPFLGGFDYTEDVLTAGGFATINNGGYYSTGEMYFRVPFKNAIMKISAPDQEQISYGPDYRGISLFTANTAPGGFRFKTDYRDYTINGERGGYCRIGMSGGYSYGSKLGQWPVEFQPTLPGLYNFGPLALHTEQWYDAHTNEPIYFTGSTSFVWRTLFLNFTQSTQNLALAVTS